MAFPPFKALLYHCGGEGKLPAILAKSARAWVSCGCSYLSDSAFSPLSRSWIGYNVAPGQLGNVGIVKKEGCPSIVFIGKVPKINLLHQLHKLDWVAVKELSKLPNFNDDTIQTGVGGVMEANGVKVLTQREFLQHLFPEIGVLTERQPSAEEYSDIDFGMSVAREIARLDIGQTVVVKDRMILAVEAIEGTDEAIKRAVKLARGPVVVCKVSKQGQDQRFDTPTVGMSTLQAMIPESNPAVSNCAK
jgi:hypothetical protein